MYMCTCVYTYDTYMYNTYMCKEAEEEDFWKGRQGRIQGVMFAKYK